MKEQVLTGQLEVPHCMSRQGKQFLKWLLTVDPSQRPTLEEVMQHPWLNRGQEGALRSYSEPPGGDLDPQVLEMMQKLGFEQDQVEQSVGQRKYDRVMGIYLILRMMETKMPGREVKVRPYRSPDSSDISQVRGSQHLMGGLKRGLSHLMGGVEEVAQPSDGGTEEASLLSDGRTEEPSILPHYLWLNVTGPPPSLESMTTPPPLDSIEFGTATPSPDLQLGPGGSPCTHSRRLCSSSSSSSSSSSIRGGAPEGAARESCCQAGQPEGSTPASSSADSQGRPGLARRAFRAFLKFTCCGLPTIKRAF
ncbi:hypothetical protein QTO34_003656 [Cnephaeus nilssonii]|uniref:non-specific serine/threonine protein kinase n=1 Tax=Cnephaeus nilssonii TaxID=3371016 RepID=A0AA40HR88_CNENI|nr:hypothetical protein QTO34_003656 [Eptesicus nilssonii]